MVASAWRATVETASTACLRVHGLEAVVLVVYRLEECHPAATAAGARCVSPTRR